MSTHWLFVDGAHAFGGHEVMLLRWLDELRLQHRVVPIVLARAGSRLRHEVSWCAASEDLPVHRTQAPRWLPHALGKLWLKARNAYRDAMSVRRVLRRLRPALCIVAEGCLLSQPVFAVVARLMKVRTIVYIPLVETAATMGFSHGGVVRDAIAKHAYVKLPQGWLTITSEQALQLRAWTEVPTPIFTLPNTVTRSIEHAAQQRWEGADARARAVPPTVRVLVLGRLDAHHKGLDLLLDYLERTPLLPCKVHLTLVGEGPYAEEIERRMRASRRLAALLTLRAWGRAAELMQQHDVLLLPSRFEGVPLVMLEAMALGLPVVASDLPGTRAMLPPDMLFPVGELHRAFNLIRDLNEPELRAGMVMRNRDKFLSAASGAAFDSAVTRLTDELLSFARYGDLLPSAHVLSEATSASEPR